MKKMPLRMEEQLYLRQIMTAFPPFFFIPNGRLFTKVILPDLMFLEAAANYVKFHTFYRIHISSYTMKDLILQLPDKLFCRVNRSIIVNLYWVEAFNKDTIFLYTGQEFGFGEKGKKEFREKTKILRID